MPEPQKKAAAKEPSRGLLSRMFGSDPMTPEMEEGLRIARKENPNLAPVEPYGFFSRFLQPKAMGYVSPGNTIYVNPNQVGQSPQDWADTLAHEQTHVNQQQSQGYGPTMQLLRSMLSPTRLPYGQRPDEIEAFQVEKERRARMGRPQSPIPSFTGNDYFIPQDINLPLPKPKNNLVTKPVTIR